ncbi:MAG: hypothetical protein IBJ16_03540 [Chitinophagaceae bacterium]|nr:hypothetical protein [Chitinophagaceae bacterium]
MSKYIYVMACVGIIFTACSKKETPVNLSVEYVNLNNAVASIDQSVNIDIDKDGTADFLVTKELKETAAGQDDLLEFRVVSNQQHKLLVQQNGTPARKEAGVWIRKEDEGVFKWDASLHAVIVTRVITPDPANAYWTGTWKEQYNKYLPIQFIKNGKTHNGWIQISFSPVLPSRIIVHDAVYNKAAGEPIQAGSK